MLYHHRVIYSEQESLQIAATLFNTQLIIVIYKKLLQMMKLNLSYFETIYLFAILWYVSIMHFEILIQYILNLINCFGRGFYQKLVLLVLSMLAR